MPCLQNNLQLLQLINRSRLPLTWPPASQPCSQ